MSRYPISQCDWSLILQPLSQCEWLLSTSVTGPWSSSHSASVSDSSQPVWLVLVSDTQAGWVTPVSQCDWSLFLLLSLGEWLQSASVTGPWSSSHSASVIPVRQCDWSLFLLLSLCEWLLSGSVTGPWSFSHSACVSDSCQAVWLVLDPPATQPVWLVLVSATQSGWVTPVRQCDWSLILQPLSQCEWLQSGSVTGPWSSSHSARVSDVSQAVWLVFVSCYSARVSDFSQLMRLVLDPPVTQPVWVTPVSQCDWSLILQPLSQCEWFLSASVTGPCFCYSARVSDSSQPVWLVLDLATQPGWVDIPSASVTGPWSSSH